jgi:hypothetical protein
MLINTVFHANFIDYRTFQHRKWCYAIRNGYQILCHIICYHFNTGIHCVAWPVKLGYGAACIAAWYSPSIRVPQRNSIPDLGQQDQKQNDWKCEAEEIFGEKNIKAQL